MKITFDLERDRVVFRVAQYDPRYEDVLKACFYAKENDSYIKRFPGDLPHLPAIQANYARHVEEMLSQLARFSPTGWQDALLAFARRMEGGGIFWWLTGSCAACVHGVPLEPHDVDIMIRSTDVNAVADLFSDCIIEPIIDTGGWVTRHFGVVFLHARIDIAADPQPCLDEPEPADCGPYALARLQTVMWKGHAIRVPPLELLVAVNRRRGREERAQLIEEHLRKGLSEAQK